MADIWHQHKEHTEHLWNRYTTKHFLEGLAGFYLKVYVPGEAKMLGELCEDEVFSQQGVRLSRLYQLLWGQGN